MTLFGSTPSFPLTTGSVFSRSKASSEWKAAITSVASRSYNKFRLRRGNMRAGQQDNGAELIRNAKNDKKHKEEEGGAGADESSFVTEVAPRLLTTSIACQLQTHPIVPPRARKHLALASLVSCRMIL